MCVNERRLSTRHGGRGREGAREPKRMKLHVNHASLPGRLLRAPAWHKRVCLCACIRCAYLNALLSILKVFNLSVCRFCLSSFIAAAQLHGRRGDARPDDVQPLASSRKVATPGLGCTLLLTLVFMCAPVCVAG